MICNFITSILKVHISWRELQYVKSNKITHAYSAVDCVKL